MFTLDFDRDMGVRLVLTARRTAHRKQARRETSARRRTELGDRLLVSVIALAGVFCVYWWIWG